MELVTQSAAIQKIVVEKVNPPRKKILYDISKRAFDLVICLVAFLIALVPMVLIGIFIKAETKGPAIYKQERLGKNGKSFIMYKFRSMYNDAERDGAKWAAKDDKRITKVGAFLRKCRLDELPQLVNIILGQMSIVGPRPERPIFYDEFDTYIDGFRQRMYVKPGLTGLAQVNGGYDLKPEEKIIYDMEYIENLSLWQDFKIIVKTIWVVFNHKGAR